MASPPLVRPPDTTPAWLGRAYGVALVWWAISSLLGALLRADAYLPEWGLTYRHWLHAHSHVALLGWVFNACVVLALACHTRASFARGQTRLFLILQIAVLGMLLSYPAQGYGAVSIGFSTLHLGAAALFAWRLWHHAEGPPAVRWPLRMALVWLVVSGLGPLALGPLAAAGLRDHAAYALAIYFYLHAQYNGWFVFFLLSLVVRGAAVPAPDRVRRACLWLGAGTVLTLAHTTLWLDPPRWVHGVALLGALAQWIGAAHLVGLMRSARPAPRGLGLLLLRVAGGAFVIKLCLQTLAAWPAWAPLVNHRFVVIAFLHLVFIGMMTAALLAAGFHRGWLTDKAATRWATTLWLSGFIGSEVVLVWAVLPLPSLPWSFAGMMLVSSALMSLGAVVFWLARRAGRSGAI